MVDLWAWPLWALVAAISVASLVTLVARGRRPLSRLEQLRAAPPPLMVVGGSDLALLRARLASAQNELAASRAREAQLRGENDKVARQLARVGGERDDALNKLDEVPSGSAGARARWGRPSAPSWTSSTESGGREGMAYAQGTDVDTAKSRIEIERLLQRAECSHVGVMHEPGKAVIFFQRQGWAVQMTIPIPGLADAPKAARRGYRSLSEGQRQEWVEQKARERWRQLLLVLKAKFTALEEGVETFEQTFFAHLVVGGVHLGEKLLPLVRQAQEKGTQLLLGAGGEAASGG